MKEEQKYLIGAFAKLTGVTERTLRHYDRVNLLKPSSYTAQGHRLYTEKDLFTLQKILTLKLLDFSLEDIAGFIHDSKQSLVSTLAAQSDLLRQKKDQLERVIAAMERVSQLIDADAEEEVDSSLVLALIHMVQYEKEQQEWVSLHVSPSYSDLIFMKDKSPEERFELEQRVTRMTLELKKLYKAGCSPEDEGVYLAVKQLLELILEIIYPATLEDLSLNIAEQINEEGEIVAWKEPDPFLFPSFFDEGEEAFIEAAINYYNEVQQEEIYSAARAVDLDSSEREVSS